MPSDHILTTMLIDGDFVCVIAGYITSCKCIPFSRWCFLWYAISALLISYSRQVVPSSRRLATHDADGNWQSVLSAAAVTVPSTRYAHSDHSLYRVCTQRDMYHTLVLFANMSVCVSLTSIINSNAPSHCALWVQYTYRGYFVFFICSSHGPVTAT